MTSEQKENIKKDIQRTILTLARSNGVYTDEIESILAERYIKEDDFTIIRWPENQDLMCKEGFGTNCSLANDGWTLSKYGPAAYFVNKQWLNSL